MLLSKILKYFCAVLTKFFLASAASPPQVSKSVSHRHPPAPMAFLSPTPDNATSQEMSKTFMNKNKVM